MDNSLEDLGKALDENAKLKEKLSCADEAYDLLIIDNEKLEKENEVLKAPVSGDGTSVYIDGIGCVPIGEGYKLMTIEPSEEHIQAMKDCRKKAFPTLVDMYKAIINTEVNSDDVRTKD